MIPRVHSMVCSAHLFPEKKDKLEKQGYRVLEPMYSNGNVCINYMKAEDVHCAAMQSFNASDVNKNIDQRYSVFEKDWESDS